MPGLGPAGGADGLRPAGAPVRGAARLGTTARGSYLALILLGIVWEGWASPAPRVPDGWWLTVKTLPLLLPLPGILRLTPRSLFWGCLLSLAYFTEGVVVAYSRWQWPPAWDRPMPYALMEVLLALLFFFSAALFIRHRA